MDFGPWLGGVDSMPSDIIEALNINSPTMNENEMDVGRIGEASTAVEVNDTEVNSNKLIQTST